MHYFHQWKMEQKGAQNQFYPSNYTVSGAVLSLLVEMNLNVVPWWSASCPPQTVALAH